MPCKIITKQIKEDIVAFYKSRPMTHEEVAEKFHYSLPTIIKIFKEYKVKPYPKAKIYSPNLIENYFETIDTEKKAYFLGLLITDGCIHNNKHGSKMVNITLQLRDVYIIEDFIKEIKLNKKIVHDNRHQGCGNIQVLSNKMVDDLMQYGITYNKSLKTIFPKNIPLNLYPHLIRGILDGDGSIAFYARHNRKVHVKAIRFCQGNEQFLIDLMKFLEEKVNIKIINTYKEKENLWSIAYRSNDSLLKLYNYLYNDATIYIKRKKELCDKLINEINYYHGSTEITTIVTNSSIVERRD